MAKLVAFVGAKGGTLKTSSVAAVSHVIAQTGIPVAIVDADPQADLTSRSGFSRVTQPLESDAVRVSFEGIPPLNLHLFRGGRSLESASTQALERHLARAQAMPVNLVIVDTPPAIGPITTTTLAAASMVVIPAVPGRESVERGLDVVEITRRVNPDAVIRFLITMANTQSNLYQWMTDQVDERFPGLRMKPVIPIEMAAGEAAVFQLPVTISSPKSKAALAYCDLGVEILGHTHVGRHPVTAASAGASA